MRREIADLVQIISRDIGYSEEELRTVPGWRQSRTWLRQPHRLCLAQRGRDRPRPGVGCGVRCLSRRGEGRQDGKVIGVDMTPEMLDLARRNSAKANTGMSNSGSAKSKACRSPMTPSIASSPIASSIFRQKKTGSSRKPSGSSSRAEG